MAKAHCMAVARDPLTGAALLSATINVYNPGTVTPISATIFDKSNNVLSNPLTSDPTTGLIDFYLNVAQEVDLVVSKASYTTRTYSNVPVIDDASFDLTALMTATGDTVYASGANTPARLAVGAQGTFYNVGGGSIPRWGNTIDAGGLTVTAGGLTVTAGNVGIGTAQQTNVGLTISETLSGSTNQAGIVSNPTGNSSATTEVYGFESTPGTAAASFTCTNVGAFHAVNPIKGAGSTITTASGLTVDSITSGTTNCFGVYINAPSGGAGSNIGLVNLGTSQLVGGSIIGGNSAPPATGLILMGAVPAATTNQVGLGYTFAAVGGGATATLGTIGGSGPTVAGMNQWWQIKAGGATYFIPIWA